MNIIRISALHLYKNVSISIFYYQVYFIGEYMH